MKEIILRDMAKLASYKNASITITDINAETEIKPNNQLISDYPGNCVIYGIRAVDNNIQILLEQEPSIIKHWKNKYGCEAVK